jgi:hypothetical protein
MERRVAITIRGKLLQGFVVIVEPFKILLLEWAQVHHMHMPPMKRDEIHTIVS